ncbi:MAG: hypothetical protein DI595_19040 [Agrobacterium fabrum]|uniref:Uncharacterized protein n=1 Tax=Agrobacterium fabrum TaxID=1176649 RepID=A0A2W5GHV1_9HYPH|nr:MAG: hypothetical protein DI595_19040 [Agrobacterium fabrum]
MEIAFCSQELRALFESAQAMRTKFGTDAADTLMTLISELRAAESIEDIVGLHVHTTSAVPPYSIAISTDKRLWLEIRANHVKIPTGSHGFVAWEHVYMIKIMGIENGS